jgi:hypothetical protein
MINYLETRYIQVANTVSSSYLEAISAIAQPAADPDHIPDAMPFDLALGTPINLERAEAAINAAIAESKEIGN